jgi:asparagine synthase (glutamine-hydrolysing)
LSRAADEPFGNSSVVPAYYCSKMARERDVALMLAGDGGDEIFAGNSRYIDQQIFDFYDHVPEFVRAYMLEPVLFHTPGLAKTTLGRKARNYVQRARLPMPDRAEARNFYQNTDLADVLETDVLRDIDRAEPLANLRDAYERTRSRTMLQRMMHLDLKITLADNDLRKVAIASDMAGVPSAYPFLDDDVVEFAAQIPSSLLIRWLSRRWFFRQAVKDFLPPETLAKRKHGFGMPYTEWPRDNAELRDITLDCVNGFRRRHYFKSDFLDRFVGGAGDGSVYDSLVWDIVMLELWLRERDARL